MKKYFSFLFFSLLFVLLLMLRNFFQMDRIKLIDREFELFIPFSEIEKAVKKIAGQINRDLEGEDVLFICILNGSFMFTAELLKEITIANTEITFLKLSSYEGTDTTGQVKELIGLYEPIDGRTLVILEDIIDTGITILEVMEILKLHHPKSVKIATMLLKPEKFKDKIAIDYVGMEIGNDFIVGFGLDYNRKGRNLKDIYKVIE
jgi:hypoxanthine phosphoribosyltransferase